jgi:hypothetical protein
MIVIPVTGSTSKRATIENFSYGYRVEDAGFLNRRSGTPVAS